MSNPIEYAQQIDELLRDADSAESNTALGIAKHLVEFRLGRKAHANAWAGWSPAQDQNREESQANS